MSAFNNESFPDEKEKIVKLAVYLVPFVKYAVGLLGIAVVVSSIYKVFKEDLQFGIWGIVLGIALMGVLFLFSRFLVFSKNTFRGPAILLSWGLAILFMSVLSLIVSSIFFNFPLKLCKWIDVACVDIPKTVITQKEPTPPIEEKPRQEDKPHQEEKTTNTGGQNNTNKNNINKEPSTFLLSLQLPKSRSYKSIYINKMPAEILAESTPLNPRINVKYSQLPASIQIITSNGDTCTMTVGSKPDPDTYRLVPECLN